MADEIDQANDQAERHLSVSMRLRMPAGPEANGECHHCGSPVAPGLRWCDRECRDGWQREQRRGL